MPIQSTGPTFGRSRILGSCWHLSIVGTMLALSGCTSINFAPLNGRTVKIEGASDRTQAAVPYMVQVENKLGSVRIYASPRIKAPEVYAAVGGESEPRLATWVAASIENRPDQRVLRVLSADPKLEGLPVTLFIYVPAISGLVVRNTGGNVLVRDATGPIQVFNGITDGNGGNVDIRTQAALAGPVNINTRNGDVTLMMGRGSIGRLDIRGKQGVSVQTPALALAGIRTTATTYKASMGVWGQEFKVQADDGKVALRVAH